MPKPAPVSAAFLGILEFHFWGYLIFDFFTCYYSKCHSLYYQGYDAGLEVVLEKTNYVMNLINNSYF